MRIGGADCSDGKVDYSQLTKVETTNDLYYTNAAGKRHGLHKQWYDNARKQLSTQQFWCNDLLEGSFTSWYEDGNKHEEGMYKGGYKTGLWTLWRDNGNKQMEGMHLNNKVFWYGPQDGLWTYWWPDGKKAIEIIYANSPDLLNNTFVIGLMTSWYANGNKWEETNFGMGTTPDNRGRDGLYTYWYENGNKKLEGNYTNNQVSGIWTWWNEDGSCDSKADYTKTPMENILCD